MQATRFRQWATNVLDQADEKAEQKYEIFNKTQLIESDFDREVKKLITAER